MADDDIAVGGNRVRLHPSGCTGKLINYLCAVCDTPAESFTDITVMANKVIAADLGISERTVEVHRSKVMKKLGTRTLAQLVRIYLELE